VQKCKSARGLFESAKVKPDFRVRSAEYGGANKGDWLAGVSSIGEVKGDSAKVQIGAELLCKGGKVGDRAQSAGSSAEYRLRSTESRAGAQRAVRKPRRPSGLAERQPVQLGGG